MEQNNVPTKEENHEFETLWSEVRDFVKEKSYLYQGHLMPKVIAPRYLKDIVNFEVRPDDVYILTYPKSGTTWAQNIICLILETKGRKSDEHLFDKVQYLEFPEAGESGPLLGVHGLTVCSLVGKRHEPNVLFLKYEDMQKDLRGSVLKIAKFLEHTLSDNQVDAIVEKSSFKAMKSDPMVNPDTSSLYFQDGVKQNTDKSFMRKGKVGDWKNFFTVAQNEQFDALYEKMTRGTGLVFDDFV